MTLRRTAHWIQTAIGNSQLHETTGSSVNETCAAQLRSEHLAPTPLLRLKGTGCGVSCVASRARSLMRSPTRPSCPCWPLPHVSTPPARVSATQWSAPASCSSQGVVRNCLWTREDLRTNKANPGANNRQFRVSACRHACARVTVHSTLRLVAHHARELEQNLHIPSVAPPIQNAIGPSTRVNDSCELPI